MLSCVETGDLQKTHAKKVSGLNETKTEDVKKKRNEKKSVLSVLAYVSDINNNS